MIQPWWKRWLSYLFEFHIESTSSAVNEQLHISFYKNQYQLFTKNAIYSFGDLYNNFKQAFKLLQLPADHAKVLVLGLGLGSVPLILEKRHHKTYAFTAIEIDEEVIALTSKYTLPQLQSSMTMICTDAMAWVMQCEEKFDLIAIDIFLDDLIPERFEQKDFLTKVKSLIAPKGILLYNRLAFTTEDKELSKVFFENNFMPVFENGTFLEVHRNWMLVSDKSKVL